MIQLDEGMIPGVVAVILHTGGDKPVNESHCDKDSRVIRIKSLGLTDALN